MIPARGSQRAWGRAGPLLAALALAAAGCTKQVAPPVAALQLDGAALAHPVGQLLVVDGSKSADPRGAGLSYRWRLQDKPAGSHAALAQPQLAVTTLLPDVEGDYALELVVSDGTLTSVASARFTAQCGVAAPTVQLGPASGDVQVGVPVALAGSASDLDTQAPCSLEQDVQLSWRLSEVPAGSGAQVSGATGDKPWFVPDLPGAYEVEARATDSTGRSSSAHQTFTVGVCGTHAPVVTELAATAAAVGQSVQLSAQASDEDASGTCRRAQELAWQWAFVARPSGSGVQLNGEHLQNPSFTPDVPGRYTLSLQVTDPEGHAGVRTLDVDASACGSNVPVLGALAATPASPAVGQAVSFAAPVTDGDNDACALGQTFRLAWTVTQQPAGSQAQLSDAAAKVPWLVPDLPGLYVVSVRATDSTGLTSAPKTVQFAVGSCGSQAPAATIQLPAQPVLGRPVQLAATVLDADSDAACGLVSDVRYQWSFEALPAGSQAQFNGARLAAPSFTPDLAGDYVVRLVVADAEGHLSPLARATLHVGQCGGQAPVASIGQIPASPAVGQPVLVTASATDADNLPACGQSQTVHFAWALDALPAGSKAQLSPLDGSAPSFVPDLAGDYRVRLVATDSTGRQSALATRTITVGACGSANPTVQASASATQTAVGLPVQLSAQTDDADLAAPCSQSQTVSVQWRFDALPAGSRAQLSGTGALHPSFIPDVAGDYVLSVVAVDSTGRQSGAASVTVTASRCGTNAPVAAVSASPSAPIAGQTVRLAAEASDLDNAEGCGMSQTLSYEWRLDVLPAGSKAQLTSATSPTPAFTADVGGTYEATLVVTDSTGRQSAAQSVAVSVSGCGSSLPGATVTPSPAVPAVGRSVSLAAVAIDTDNSDICQSRQNAPALQTFTFEWTLLAAPTGSKAQLSSTTARSPWLTPDLAGTYVARLVVTDSTGRQSLPVDTSLSVGTCGANAPAAPVLHALPVLPNAGQQVALTADVTDTDNLTSCQAQLGAPQAIGYQWRIALAPAGSQAQLSGATQPAPFFRPDLPGTYRVELTVTDSTGRSATSSLQLTAGSCGLAPPTAQPQLASNTLVLGSPVLVRSNASDADNASPCSAAQTLSYRWSFLELPAGSKAAFDNARVKDASFTPDVAGTYLVQVRVTDSAGLSSAGLVPVTVGICGQSAPQPRTNVLSPSATSPQTDTVVNPLLSCQVQLGARGSFDPDTSCGLPQTADQLNYRWVQTQAPLGSQAALNDPASATPSLSIDVGGTYAFRLYASDGMLESQVPATLTIVHAGFSVAQVQPPVACATSLPGSLTLTAGGQGFLRVTQGTTVTLPAVTANFTGSTAPVSPNQLTISGCTPVANNPGVDSCTTLVIGSLPALTPGNYTIGVTNPVQNGCGATAVFSVGAPPTISQVNPTSVCAVADPLRADQASLDLTGSGLVASTQVYLGSTLARSTTFTSSTQISALVDIPAPGTYDVRVSNGAGCESTKTSALTVLPVPLVFFVDPPVVYNGMATQATLYVSGINGGSVSQVRIRPSGSSLPLQNLTFTANTQHSGQLQLSIPAGLAAGTWDVYVTDAAGCTSIPVAAIRVTGSQTLMLSSIDPPFGYRGSSTAVDLRAALPSNPPQGAELFTGQPRVYLSASGSTSATALASVSLSSSSLANAVVPSGLPAGTYDVIAVSPDGAVGVLAGAFRVTTSPPPLVDAVVPGSIGSGGVPVTVRGQNFSSPQVSFDCVDTLGGEHTYPGQVSSSSSTIITVTTPSSLSAGMACVVSVRNPDGSYGEFSALGVTNSSENMNQFNLTSAMTTARRAPATTSARATRAARFLYAMGGDNGTVGGALSTIEAAPLDRFGNLGAWRVLSTQTPAAGSNTVGPRTLAQAVTVDRFVYLLGGDAGSGPVALAHRAKVLDPAETPAISDLYIQLDPAGCLNPGLWFYRVAATFGASDATNPGGETLPSDPLPLQIPSGLGQRVMPTLSWTAVAGATGYRIYRTASVDQTVDQVVLLATVDGTTTSFTDRTTGTTPACASPGTAVPHKLGALGHWVALPSLKTAREGHSAAAIIDPADPTHAYVYAFSGQVSATNTENSFETLPVTIAQGGGSQSSSDWTRNTTLLTSGGRFQASAWVVGDTVTTRVTTGEAWLYLGPGRTLTNGSPGFTSSVDAVRFTSGTGALTGTSSTQWYASRSVTGGSRAGFGYAAAANQLWIFGGNSGNPDSSITSGQLCGIGVSAPCSPAPGTQNWNSNGGNTLQMPRSLMGSAVESARIFQVGGLTLNSQSQIVPTNTVESVIW